MKTYFWLVLLFLILLLPLRLFSAVPTFAQEESKAPPAQIQLTVDRTTLNVGDSSQAILILRNTSPYTLTGIAAQFQGTAFKTLNLTNLPDTLSPYSSTQAEYTLQSQVAGSHNVTFAVQYSWDDPNIGLVHQWIETVSATKFEVAKVIPWWFNFDWPAYLIPLIIGLVVGWVGAWFAEWRKQRQEEKQQEEQVAGITLAMLQAIRKGIEQKEAVRFNLWEEAVVKGNLYPALHRLGRRIGKPELSKRLAELSITLIDYNDRQGKKFSQKNLQRIWLMS
ncbi:MAG: hypothetical protein HC875_21800 [Anaerolineales bacterium]|nr:hypothetical protein [Anaerolineales bacterium]